MNAKQIFDTIRQFNTVKEIKEWAASVGYDFNPDYTGYDDENDHPNYQNFFHLEVLFAEIGNNPYGDYKIIYHPAGNEILASSDSENYYNDLIATSEVHAIKA